MQLCAIKDTIPFFIKNIFFFLQIYKHAINTATPRNHNAIANTLRVDDPSFACFSLEKKQNKSLIYILTLNIV